ncbi:hypothetical protein NPIL_679011, partial [Nephila pilipes]
AGEYREHNVQRHPRRRLSLHLLRNTRRHRPPRQVQFPQFQLGGHGVGRNTQGYVLEVQQCHRFRHNCVQDGGQDAAEERFYFRRLVQEGAPVPDALRRLSVLRRVGGGALPIPLRHPQRCREGQGRPNETPGSRGTPRPGYF